MNLKQKTLQKQSKLNPNRLKVHAIKRFRSAAETAKSLPSDSLDQTTELEVEAYQLQMQAIYLLETFKYELALDLLLKAKFIYEAIL